MFRCGVCSRVSVPDLEGIDGVKLTVERYTPPLLRDGDEVRSRDRTGLTDLDERAEVGVSTALVPS